jgi:disulfide oxidoreductase YuzD
MTYPNLDWLIPWYVDDYISLNQEQRRFLDKRLIHALDWHCQTQLPAYGQTLKDLASDLDDPHLPLSVERLHAYADQLKILWRVIKMQIGPEMAEILATASDEQLAELFENVEQRNNTFKAKYVDIPLDQLEQKRNKKMIKRIKRWFSQITPVQKQAVADWSAEIRPLAADGLNHRQRVTAELRNLLARRQDSPDFKSAFVDLLVNIDQRRSAHYQNNIDVNTDLTLKLLAKIERSLTSSQRSYLLGRINALSADFEKLNCDPATAHLSTQE